LLVCYYIHVYKYSFSSMFISYLGSICKLNNNNFTEHPACWYLGYFNESSLLIWKRKVHVVEYNSTITCYCKQFH